MNRIYACIDLKSFYASVECVERGLDPLTTNLVVADKSRTSKTICLAVTPSLKKYGLSGRSRLYEVEQVVDNINKERKKKCKKFLSKSYNDLDLSKDSSLELDYIVATPRMRYYMEYSTNIYKIYLKYLSPDDVYVYSIDEVFCDITSYLKLYGCSPKELVTKIIHDVYSETGITATAGIGTNLYLAKVAMDIVAKHREPDKYGVRIACLDEDRYKKILWGHKPITDFWRVGKGISKKLSEYRIYTMGDLARISLTKENLLFNLFGVEAELLIDHAWGYEPCTMDLIKSYKPSTSSLSTGQVLSEASNYSRTRLIVKEMSELLSLDIVEKHYVTKKLTLTIGYDVSNLTNPDISRLYDGEITLDFYGREVPKHAHGTINLDHKTSSTKVIVDNVIKLFDRVINKNLLVRRINISACDLSSDLENEVIYKQFDLFTDSTIEDNKIKKELQYEKNDKKIEKTILDIKYKYGKNSILKGMNLEEGATTIERNMEVGGHRG